MLATNKVAGIKSIGSDKLIEKFIEPKTKKLLKSQNCLNQEN